jgi:hypothetical protein
MLLLWRVLAKAGRAKAKAGRGAPMRSERPMSWMLSSCSRGGGGGARPLSHRGHRVAVNNGQGREGWAAAAGP